MILRQIHIHGLFVLGRLEKKYGEEFEEVFPKWIKEGKIKYLEDVKKGWESIGEAILEQQEGRNMGKSVVIVAEE